MKMLLASLLILLCASSAFAAGKRVVDPNNRPLAYNAPYPAASGCTTTTTTKGSIASVPVAGYSQICWEASDSSNAAKRIRRYLNSNTAYLPGTGGCIGLTKEMTAVAFKPYSGASAAYTVCYELERGGTTP